MKKKHVFGRAVIIVLVCLIIAFCGGVMGYKADLQDFFDNSTPAFSIPDIHDGFIPQGIAWDAESGCFFLTGYMGNGKVSPIYAIDAATGSLKNKVGMLTENGEKFRGHAGGLSVYRGSLYVAGSTDACMYSFPIRDVLQAENGAFLPAKERIDLKTNEDFIRVSFTSTDGQRLYAGEFHKGAIFYTHDSHRVEEDGIVQEAYLFGFTLEEDGVEPFAVFSIPDSIQGACFADGYLYLSRSRGLLAGSILSYSLSEVEACGVKNVLGVNVPLFILTEDNAARVTTVPPMCEEMVVRDGKMYIAFEAAANRYLIGKALGLEKVYAVPVEYFQ